MKIYLNHTLYEALPTLWLVLVICSAVVAVLADNLVPALTALIALYNAIRIVGLRAEYRVTRTEWW